MRLEDKKLQSTNNLPKLAYELEPTVPKKSLLSDARGVILGLSLGILLTLVGTQFIPQSQTQPTQTPKIAPTTTQAPAQSVTLATVQASPVNRTLKATGTVNAFELIPILSKATGLQIQQILADEGDNVRAGQLLARLDDSVLQAQLVQAQASVAQYQARLAELKAGTRSEEVARAEETVQRIKAEISQAQSDWELAKKRVERNQNLEAEGAIARDRLDEVLNEERSKKAVLQQTEARLRESQQQLAELKAGERSEVIAQAVAQLAEAKAKLQLVQTQLTETRIISPVSGKVVERNARVGDTTNGQNPLFKIVENGRLELRLKVTETELPLIRPGQRVNITSDADSSLKLSGKVREIYPIVDETSRQATVKVDLPSQNTLKPGMFLRASIITETAVSLTVPMEAILPQPDGQAVVYVVQTDNTVKAQRVTMGEILAGEKVEILSGLNAGERIVAKGSAYLNDGDKITVAGS